MTAEGEIQKQVVIHSQGYSRFLRLMRWGAAASFIIAMIVILLIAE
jgi:hypothetical protein